MQSATTTAWYCDLLVGISKSSSYPGYIQGSAQVVDCVGTPYPSECAATAEMEYASPYGWSNDGEGRTAYGCPGPASVITKSCTAASTKQTHRTRGIYVIIESGVTYTKHDYSGDMSVYRYCSPHG